MVDGDCPAPPELRLAWECERYHCLPDPGGYLDQDYKLLIRMSSVSNVNSVYARFRTLQGRQIHSLSDGDRRTLRVLKDMGLIFKG